MKAPNLTQIEGKKYSLGLKACAFDATWLIAVMVLFADLAFRSAGHDWWIHEINAWMISHSLWLFHEFPSFSFLVQGGSMLSQDPQGPWFSWLWAWVGISGPLAGIRWEVVLLSGLGALGMRLWLSHHFDPWIARLGALSWVLSVGFFWREIAGHTMFAYHFLAPFFLILLDRWGRTPVRMIGGGLFLGAFLAAPTAQSLVYFIVPLGLFYFLFLVTSRKKNTA